MTADIGTRKGAKIKDIKQDSEWINGKPWRSMEECDFPLKTVQDIALSQGEADEMEKETINLGLIDEFTNSSKVVLNNMSVGREAVEIENRYAFSEYIIDPNRFRFKKVLRILALVLMFVKKFRRFPAYNNEYLFELPKSFSCKGSQYIMTTGTNDVIKCEPGKVVCLSDDDIKAALTYFFIKATAETKRFLSIQKYRDITTEVNGILYYNNRIE